VALDPVTLKTLALEFAASLPPVPPADMQLTPVDVSWRARTMRSIQRIADQHRWQDAVTMFLETKGVPYLSDLTDPQLDDLMDRMHGYVDAAETGSSLPDCLPAS